MRETIRPFVLPNLMDLFHSKFSLRSVRHSRLTERISFHESPFFQHALHMFDRQTAVETARPGLRQEQEMTAHQNERRWKLRIMENCPDNQPSHRPCNQNNSCRADTVLTTAVINRSENRIDPHTSVTSQETQPLETVTAVLFHESLFQTMSLFCPFSELHSILKIFFAISGLRKTFIGH